MIDALTLFSGCDIPFPEGRLIIHHPTLKEISFVGEKDFFLGCQILTISKDNFEIEDKVDLSDITNFEILMSIMKDSSGEMRKQQIALRMLFSLLFPNCLVKVSEEEIIFFEEDKEDEQGFLDEDNFNSFKEIVVKMFCLQHFFGSEAEDDSWMGETARRIAQKLKERKKKLQEQNEGNSENSSIFTRYISILSVGEHKDMNSFFNLTIFQLLDEFQRFELKINFDFYVQAQMAGAKDLKDVDDWMKELHP